MADKTKGKIVGTVGANHAMQVLAYAEMEKIIPALGMVVQQQRNELWRKIEEELNLSPDRIYQFEFPNELRINVVDVGPIPKKGADHGQKR